MTAPRINSRLAGRLACALVVTLTLGWATTAAADGEASAASPHPADPGPGQTERIRFAPGTDNATVRGTFDSGADDRYVLRARAGQTMVLSGAFGGLGVGVLAPDGSPLPGGPADSITYQLPATGDYTITIGPRRSEATSYSFTVTIPAAERIRFAPGTNTASRHADLLPATAHRYVLRAVAGQTMVVHVAPLVHNITLSIFGPDGTALAEDLEQATVVLPATGDYLVVVETTSSGGPYQITFWIRLGPESPSVASVRGRCGRRGRRLGRPRRTTPRRRCPRRGDATREAVSGPGGCRSFRSGVRGRSPRR